MGVGFTRRVRAGLANFFVGDALGAPIESLHYRLIDRLYGKYGVRGLVRPPKNHPARTLPPWSVTDDSETLLLVLRTALKYRRPGPRDFAAELIRWAREGGVLSRYYYGRSTREAVKKLLGGAGVKSSGIGGDTNGGPTRASVAGLLNPGDPASASREAVTYCIPTHNTWVALSAASLIASLTSLIAIGLGMDEAVRVCVKRPLRYGGGYLTPAPSVKDRVRLAIGIVRRVRNPFKAARRLHDVIGPGFHSAEGIPIAVALAYRLRDEPREALLAALNMGGDTDTVAALTGLLVGVYSGRVADEVWVEEVVKRNGIDLEGLVKGVEGLVRERGYEVP